MFNRGLKPGMNCLCVEKFYSSLGIVLNVDDVPGVVAVQIQLIDDRLDSFFRKMRVPAHDPDVLLIRHADHGPLVVRSKSDHQVIKFQRPEWGHFPVSIRVFVVDPAFLRNLFNGTGEGTLIVIKTDVDPVRLRVPLVGFNGVEDIFLKEGEASGDDIPISHEAVSFDEVDGAIVSESRGKKEEAQKREREDVFHTKDIPCGAGACPISVNITLRQNFSLVFQRLSVVLNVLTHEA